MKKMLVPVAVFFAALTAVLVASCARIPDNYVRLESSSVRKAGYYFEALDLNTPESSFHNLREAWVSRDFLTVYFIMGFEAQTEFQQAYRSFRMDAILKKKKGMNLQQAVSELPCFSINPKTADHVPENSLVFMELLRFGSEKGILPLEFTANSRAVSIETPDQTTVRITTSDSLRVTLKRDYALRWRLKEIITTVKPSIRFPVNG